MQQLGENVIPGLEKPFAASTDMGNVTRTLPGIHAAFVIPTTAETALHSVEFAAAAGTRDAHIAALTCGKGLAGLALTVLTDEAVAKQAQIDFDKCQ